MKKSTKVVIIIVIVLIVVQFFRPAKNTSEADPVNDIATKYDVPMNVLMVLNDGCYDCHSNYTTYPWYYAIQPVGWWMNHHIKEAQHHVNFSEFATYSPKEAAHKFHEIKEQMTNHAMPIKAYKLMHKKAQLTDKQYQQVADWAGEQEDKIEQGIYGK